MLEDNDLPPSILYKYYPLGEWLPKLLTGTSIKFSSRTTFNDPLDSRPAFRIDTGPEGREFVNNGLRRAGLKGAARLAESKRLLRQNGKPRAFGLAIDGRVLDRVGILCLTDSWSNALMWAHYGKDHQGVCIGFRTDIDVFRVAHPIIYSKVAPVIRRPQDTNDEMIGKAFFFKDQCWAYENEWRIIKDYVSEHEQAHLQLQAPLYGPDDFRILAEQKGADYYQFDARAIESVTLGMCVTPKHQADVLGWVRDLAAGVPLYKMDRPVDSYDLTRTLLRRPSKHD